jgi:hypothetical protein
MHFRRLLLSGLAVGALGFVALLSWPAPAPLYEDVRPGLTGTDLEVVRAVLSYLGTETVLVQPGGSSREETMAATTAVFVTATRVPDALAEVRWRPVHGSSRPAPTSRLLKRFAARNLPPAPLLQLAINPADLTVTAGPAPTRFPGRDRAVVVLSLPGYDRDIAIVQNSTTGPYGSGHSVLYLLTRIRTGWSVAAVALLAVS